MSRPYDSPVRRAQMAETRERIVEAGAALAHELESWDWRPLTFRAVAERAGLGERTVYRHFASEQALHEAVMQRLAHESGVDYDGLTLDDVAAIGARVFAAMATFAAPPWTDVERGVLRAEDDRRRAALTAAVTAAVAAGGDDADASRAAGTGRVAAGGDDADASGAAGTGRAWTDEEITRAAAALDVLWTAPSYQRLTTGWHLDAAEATEVIDWMIALVADSIRAGNRPTSQP